MSAAPKLQPQSATSAKTGPTGAAPKPGATGPTMKRLKKGEFIFSEGESSRAMYFLKTGIVRIFKKKGDGEIEIDSIHSGQILGELAFLDGNPRSASGEALTDCELVEVSGASFSQVLGSMPDWLKVLMKTLVGRLRTASTRIRQLESASSAYDYSEKDGKRSPHYVYLSPIDVLKISTALLLVATRNAEAHLDGGFVIRLGAYHRYGNQIMGIPLAKLTTFLDALSQVGVVRTVDQGSETSVVIDEVDFLENFIAYANEENLTEPDKRHDLTLRGFMVMSLAYKHLANYPRDAEGHVTLNVAEIRRLETEAQGKESFRLDDFTELSKKGFATNLQIISNDEALASVKADAFQKWYRFQRLMMVIQSINEQKRRGAK